jgi:hypothetical protein
MGDECLGGELHSDSPSDPAERGNCALFQFAFPNDDRLPSSRFQRSNVPRIASDVGLKLGLPEIRPSRWIGGKLAAGVAVPEASMHEYCCPIFGHNNIGPPNEIRSMKAKSEAFPMKQ